MIEIIGVLGSISQIFLTIGAIIYFLKMEVKK